jgi:endonuclease/exonuclease/phosphatase family metal-dependent hydrolase
VKQHIYGLGRLMVEACVIGCGKWQVIQRGNSHGNWFLPFVATNTELTLTGVGVWTETGALPYQAIAEAAVTDVLARGDRPMLMAGDFNLSESDDPRRLPNARMSRVARLLADAGLRSAWHSSSGEAFGRESRGTYFHYWRETEPFHIDYIFMDMQRLAAIQSITLGAYADWVGAGISDHTPLAADIDERALA